MAATKMTDDVPRSAADTSKDVSQIHDANMPINHLLPLTFRRCLSDQAIRRNSSKIFASLLHQPHTKTIKQQAPQPIQLPKPGDLAALLETLLDSGKIVLKLEIRHAVETTSRRKAKGMEKGIPAEVPRKTVQHPQNPNASEKRPKE